MLEEIKQTINRTPKFSKGSLKSYQYKTPPELILLSELPPIRDDVAGESHLIMKEGASTVCFCMFQIKEKAADLGKQPENLRFRKESAFQYLP